MKTTTPYEKLMAAKLEEVPVPNMEDSIWSRIEMQLDTGAGTQDSKTGKGGKAVKAIKATKGWWGVAGVTAAAAASMWWYTQKNEPVKTVPAVKTPAPVEEVQPVEIKQEKVKVPVRIKKVDTVSIKKVPVVVPVMDMDAGLPEEAPAEKPALVVPAVVPPVKKTRGVKGITNDDYQLGVHKDSANKRDR